MKGRKKEDQINKRGCVIEKYFPFASDIWAFNSFSSHLHEHMRSVFEMNFCECVRKLISSVCLSRPVCARVHL